MPTLIFKLRFRLRILLISINLKEFEIDFIFENQKICLETMS